MPITDQEILDGLKEAYLSLLEGKAQEYSIHGRTWKGLQLGELANEIRRMESKIAFANRRPAVTRFNPVGRVV